MPLTKYVTLLLTYATIALLPGEAAGEKLLRIGIIGCDTSHVPAFTKAFNDPAGEEAASGMKVVAAFPGGSADIASSRDRVGMFSDQIRELGVEIVDSIDALMTKVAVILLESVDGRKHLEQVRPVFAAGKPVFIDKPLAGSLADAIEIIELAQRHNAPFFSSSALRYTPAISDARSDPKIGAILWLRGIQPVHARSDPPRLILVRRAWRRNTLHDYGA